MNRKIRFRVKMGNLHLGEAPDAAMRSDAVMKGTPCLKELRGGLDISCLAAAL